MGILDRDQLLSTSKTQIQAKAWLRGRIFHCEPPLRYRFASSIDVIMSLTIPLDQYGYKRDDIRLMTDDTPWDLPTKENIVSRSCEMSLLSLFLYFVQLEAMGTLVHDARPGDSFVYYCT